MVCFSLPVAWSLVKTNAAISGMNNLSPIEMLFLDSRRERIKASIQKDYSGFESTQTRTFIFPGAGGVDELVLELQASDPNSKVVDWKEHRGSILTASFDSEAVGEAVAELILDNMDKKVNNENEDKNGSQEASLPLSIRFIGISVGAFAANAAATVVHRQQTESTSDGDDDNGRCDALDVHLVLLDPFCGRGIFGPNYGRDNFGKHATTALHILNTDDPVPTTNDSLPLCYCIDVTQAPQKKDFVPLPGDSMHSWPLAYFTRHYKEHDGVDRPNTATPTLPRGVVETVS
jgi:hypothetical protein